MFAGHLNRIRVGSLKPEKQRACGTLAALVRSTDSASPRLLDASLRLSQRCLPGSSCPCQLSRRLLCLLPGGMDRCSPSPPSSWKRKSLADVAFRLGANEDSCPPPLPPTLLSSVHRSDSRGLKLNRSVSSSLCPPTIDPFIPASPRCRYFSLNSALTSPAAPLVPPSHPPMPPHTRGTSSPPSHPPHSSHVRTQPWTHEAHRQGASAVSNTRQESFSGGG